jgi:hypothetical protein
VQLAHHLLLLMACTTIFLTRCLLHYLILFSDKCKWCCSQSFRNWRKVLVIAYFPLFRRCGCWITLLKASLFLLCTGCMFWAVLNRYMQLLQKEISSKWVQRQCAPLFTLFCMKMLLFFRRICLLLFYSEEWYNYLNFFRITFRIKCFVS